MRRRNQRWWIPPPYPDESLRSVLARAAHFYARPPDRVWRALIADGPVDAGSIDCPRPWVLARLARALGVSASEIFRCRLPAQEWQVMAHEQTAYCPLCWNEDIAAGRLLYMRRAWTHLFDMQCHIHDYPLLQIRDGWASRTPCQFPVPRFSPRESDILALVHQFAATFYGCAFKGEPWPADYRITFEQARNALIAVNYSMSVPGFSPLDPDCWPYYKLGYAIDGPALRQGAPNSLLWSHFRAISNPLNRRGALWLVAWHTLPGLDRIF